MPLLGRTVPHSEHFPRGLRSLDATDSFRCGVQAERNAHERHLLLYRMSAPQPEHGRTGGGAYSTFGFNDGSGLHDAEQYVRRRFGSGEWHVAHPLIGRSPFLLLFHLLCAVRFLHFREQNRAFEVRLVIGVLHRSHSACSDGDWLNSMVRANASIGFDTDIAVEAKDLDGRIGWEIMAGKPHWKRHSVELNTVQLSVVVHMMESQKADLGNAATCTSGRRAAVMVEARKNSFPSGYALVFSHKKGNPWEAPTLAAKHRSGAQSQGGLWFSSYV